MPGNCLPLTPTILPHFQWWPPTYQLPLSLSMTSHVPLTLPLTQGTALFPPYIAPFHPTFLSINIKIPTYQAFIPCAEQFKGYHNLLHTPRKVQWLPKHLIKIVWAGEWSREAARDCRQTNILRGCLPANPPASRPLINEIIIKKKPKKKTACQYLKSLPARKPANSVGRW